MPTYINMPSFNLNESNIPSTSVSYTNTGEQSVTNVKQMLDALQIGKVAVEPGKGLSSNDFTDAYKQKIDDMSNKIYFSSYAEFPTIGDSETLYIDTSKDAMYLYDTVNKVYKPIVVDTEQENYIIQSVL